MEYCAVIIKSELKWVLGVSAVKFDDVSDTETLQMGKEEWFLPHSEDNIPVFTLFWSNFPYNYQVFSGEAQKCFIGNVSPGMVVCFVTGTLDTAPGFIHKLEAKLLLLTTPPKKIER